MSCYQSPTNVARNLDEPCSSQVTAFVHEQLLKISIIGCCFVFGRGHCMRRLQPVRNPPGLFVSDGFFGAYDRGISSFAGTVSSFDSEYDL